jgi:glucans biosynthesis protein
MHSSSLPMHQSPRCRARTRSGSPCRSPAVKDRRRCRMHGAFCGAPKGNRKPSRIVPASTPSSAYRWSQDTTGAVPPGMRSSDIRRGPTHDEGAAALSLKGKIVRASWQRPMRLDEARRGPAARGGGRRERLV